LTNVTVTDDMVDAAVIDCGGTGSNVIPGPLAPTASVTCVATGSAVAGQYVNAGSVTGTAPTTTSPEGEPEEPPLEVTDRDLSHYFGAAPTIDIEKATNGEDADEAPGVRVSEGAAITWTYVVTNTGNVALRDIVVTDDKIAASQIDCDGTGQNVITGPLEPGASFTCIAQGLAAAGQYENTGTVTAAGPQLTGEDGEPEPPVEVTDEDLSHYFAAAPAIDIEKWTNGADADAVPGPFVMVGGSVRWTYTVTNVGNVPLMSITVTDDQVDAADIDCDGTGANLIAGPLAPGASFTCVAAGTATSGQYVNTGAVSGVDPDQQQVTDEDPSHYFGAVPGVDIEKSTNGQDADDAPGVHVGAGSVVEWTYVVTNTGNVPLTDISVADDKVPAGDIWCGGVQSHVVPGPLQPGDSLTCNAFGSAIAGPYANLGTVTAEVPGLDVVITDEDPSHYTGFAAGPPTQPAPAAVAGLPVTGGAAIPIASIVGGSVLALVGGLLVVIGRRRRKA
jgi:LPXTG-motif cell wall-anchored protein